MATTSTLLVAACDVLKCLKYDDHFFVTPFLIIYASTNSSRFPENFAKNLLCFHCQILKKRDVKIFAEITTLQNGDVAKSSYNEDSEMEGFC